MTSHYQLWRHADQVPGTISPAFKICDNTEVEALTHSHTRKVGQLKVFSRPSAPQGLCPVVGTALPSQPPPPAPVSSGPTPPLLLSQSWAPPALLGPAGLHWTPTCSAPFPNPLGNIACLHTRTHTCTPMYPQKESWHVQHFSRVTHYTFGDCLTSTHEGPAGRTQVFLEAVSPGLVYILICIC